MDFDSVVDELYAAARDEFTELRDERAKQARAAGDRQLATRIHGLRKPTTAAWLLNQLARARAGEVGRLGELGAALRRAHAELAGDELRALSRQRHELVRALTARVRQVGRERGVGVSDAVAQEVGETLDAALGDPEVAEELAAGRLSSAVRPGDVLSEQWLSSAGVAPPAGRGREKPARADRAKPTGEKAARPARDGRSAAMRVKAEERERGKAAKAGKAETERARAEAERSKTERSKAERSKAERERAERAAAERERRAEAARERAEAARRERAEAARRREEQAAARKRVREARAARGEAHRRLRDAERAEEQARKATALARAEFDRAEREVAEAERAAERV
ncbi:hypothetical protein SAMN05421810_103153 [Amycolatopsis arida]|uniref:Uncharacterized protein n=1 Tax=Amycolatopsis arida TaxID=587909 RepID=A0A1I5SJI8_9PSEU|nr:hypothetical protein [Amycolatopsis arida]TDX96464.1 hypothetical protein CLV69_103605 [Amycolatopsis arida]SFP70667.1 hypothetical protein SAMN05421810_103153 [Amycolatopsis arida]